MEIGLGFAEEEGGDSSPPRKIRWLNEHHAPRLKPGPMNDKEVPRLLGSVPALPEGAWDRWGSEAVYFVGITRDFPDEFAGLSVYAIDPTDESLPVYHVFDFTYPSVYGKVVSDLSCAVVGSSVYVSGEEGSLWVRQIGDKDEGWVEGPQFGRDKRSPELFSVGGRLYALRYFGRYDLGRRSPEEYPDAFEVLVNESWRSLRAPPPCFLGSLDDQGCFAIQGWSCLGDHSMIVHVVNYHKDWHRFFRFQHSDDFYGSWTELSVSVPASTSCRDFTYSSHLDSDDPLLLPAFSRRAIFPVFGLAAEPAGDNSLDLEVGEDIQFPWGPFQPKYNRLHWHLISLGCNRYCAIAFDSVSRLHPTIFTFDLQLAGAETASLINVCVKHHAFGKQESSTLLYGKIYFSCGQVLRTN